MGTDASTGRPPSGALRGILANPGLRRIVVAWTCGIAGDTALLVALLVIAYQHGGPLAVGLLGIIRMAPSVVAAPLAGGPASRLPASRVLYIVHLVRAAAAVAAVAILAGGGWLPALFVAAVVGSTAGALVRPMQSAAMPSLAHSPGELVEANAALSMGEGLGAFGGPVLAAVLVGGPGPLGAAIAGTVLFVVATLSMTGLGATADEAAEDAAAQRALAAIAERRAAGGLLGQLTFGLQALSRRPGAAAVMLGFSGQVFVRGLMTTLIVVMSIRLLGLGEAGVGTLNAAYGLGGLLGAIAAVSLAGRGRLGPTFAVSLAMWGLPLAVIGVLPWPLVAIAALLVTGVANATLDISGFTLFQRCVPSSDRMAVFGLLEAIVGLGSGVGAVVAPFLVDLLGERGALLVAGALLPLLALATWRRIRAVDREAVLPTEELALLRGVPMFGGLPLTALERLAEGVRAITFEPGDVVVREGDTGDAYLIVDSGRVAVSQAGRPIVELGPGEGFGEIALLHAVPRTATVTAIVPTTIQAIEQGDFLAAIAGPTSGAVASRVAAERLARAPAPTGPKRARPSGSRQARGVGRAGRGTRARKS